MAYATYDDYKSIYLLGREPLIPEIEFSFWEREAQVQIDRVTFGRLKDDEVYEEYKNPVVCAVCCVAEAFYKEDQASKKSQGVPIGGVVTSRKIDTFAETYQISTDAASKAISESIRLFLSDTGLSNRIAPTLNEKPCRRGCHGYSY